MMFLLFLGAGASKPFGIPTMKEMVHLLEERLKKEHSDEYGLYSKIKESLLQGFNYSIDIESIFSVVQGISDNISPQKMGYYPYYYISRNNLRKDFDSVEIQKSKKLRIILEDFIKEVCSTRIENKKKLEVYEHTFHVIFSKLGGMHKNFDGNVYSTDWITYTTNYDLMFEQFWADYKKIVDYFNKKGLSAHYVFDSYKENVFGGALIKLHGSLDWLKMKNGDIMKIEPGGFTRQTSEGEVMLFPIQQKDLYLNPWITLFENLKFGLATCNEWYVIGYSFNDEFIFSIFEEALNQNKKLVIIDPNSRQIRIKFRQEFQDKIIALPINFGDKAFSKQLEDFLDRKKTLEIKTKISGNTIGIKSSSIIRSAHIEDKDRQIPSPTTINSERTSYEFNVGHLRDKEIKIVAELQYTAPFEDLKLNLFSDDAEDIDYQIYVIDKIVSYSKLKTKRDSDSKFFISDPITLSSYNLFV